MGEVVGGGFFVFRRGKRSKRLRFKQDAINGVAVFLPFEHPDMDAALREAARLAHRNPGENYFVFQQVFGPVSVPERTIDPSLQAAE
jgi:hypothetical protein